MSDAVNSIKYDFISFILQARSDVLSALIVIFCWDLEIALEMFQKCKLNLRNLCRVLRFVSAFSVTFHL